MAQPLSDRVVDVDGVAGKIDRTTKHTSNQGTLVLLHMTDGRRVWAPENWLEERNGEYFLPHRAEHLPAASVDDNDAIIVPVLEETIAVGRRKRVTGGVRVTKHVRTRDEVVEPVRVEETIDVQRIPINREVTEPPPVRQEGDVTIIPILEEVLVVEKRLVVREELRITRRRREVREPHRVTLRREEAEVERLPGEEGSAGTRPAGSDEGNGPPQTR